MSVTQRRGLIFVLISAFAYGILPIFSRNLLDVGLPPISTAFWRYLIATPFIWLLIYLQRRPAPTQPLPRYRLLAMGLLYTAATLLAFYGFQLIPVSTYTTIFYTHPAFTALIALAFGECLPLVGWGALALTLVGVGLAAPDFSAGLSGANFQGLVVALLNALTVSIAFIAVSRVLRGHDEPARASGYAILGALLSLSVVAVFSGLVVPSTLEMWLNLFALGIFSTVVPIFTLTVGIQALGAPRAAIVGLVEIFFTAVFAIWFLGESRTPIQWVGSAVIIASIILLQVGRLRSPVPKHTPA
jgi:drug/metabolite transporter (DMT)-like permease